jgi:hypothetical protein
MARFNIANGSIPNFPLSVILDTQGKVKTIFLQNVSSVDIFVSDDANLLQQTSPANLPQVGLHFPPDTAGITPFIMVINKANGKLYARAQGSNAQMEVISMDIFSDKDLKDGCAG